MPSATRSRTGLRAHSAGSGVAIAKRAFLDARVRTIAFAYVFAIYSWVQAIGYHSTYPTLGDRLAFAHAFAGNDAIRLFYGYPYDVVTVGGYCAWRVGGTFAIVAAFYGVLAAVRAMRTEEEAGRAEIVLAGAVGRRTVFLSSIGAIAVGALVLWLAEFAGLVAAHLPVAGSAFLALATVAVIPAFVGVGAVASQLAPTRRGALALSSGVVVVFWLVRVVADTWGGGGFLRWASPFGWVEEMRPFAGSSTGPLVLLLAASVPALVIAGRLARGRDVGVGLFAPRDRAKPRYGLLTSPTAQTLRSERVSLAVWALGIATFAAILGMISTSISEAGISKKLQQEVAKLGTGSIFTPVGYLSFVFIAFILAVSFFVCAQMSAARQEESGQQLETLLALPVGRRRWLAGRILVAALGAAALSLIAGVVTWAGAVSQGVSLSFPRLLEAGFNCLPTSLLFLGLSALLYALAPRASTALSYLLVSVAFLWYAVGSLLNVPQWVVAATPFKHIGFVPTEPFQFGGALVMSVIGLAAMATSLMVFRHRDIISA